MARIQRKITGATDPVKGGSKKKTGAAASAAAKSKPAKAKPAAAAPKARPAKAKPAAAASKKKEVHPADKKLNNERAAFLKKEASKGKAQSIEARLKERKAAFDKRVAGIPARIKLRRQLVRARNMTARQNLKLKQDASWTNLLARQKARYAAIKKAGPYIKDGKIHAGKPEHVKIKLVKPKLKPIPRMSGGKIVTTKRTKPPKHDASRKQAAKKAVRTKKKGTAVV